MNEMVDVLITTIGRRSLAQAVIAAGLQSYENTRTVVIADGPSPRAENIVNVTNPAAVYHELPERMGHGGAVKQWWIDSGRASEFIKFLDDDDWMSPYIVEEMLPAFDDPQVAACACPMLSIFTAPHRRTHRIVPGVMMMDRIGSGCLMIRTAAAQGLDWIHVRGADYIWLKKLLARGPWQLAHTKRPLYIYNGYRIDTQRKPYDA